jgi:uncharacterized membrane protein YadS
VSVTTLSTIAMLLYPPIARGLALPPAMAGLFIGGSIHDVAQVIGAGYSLGTAAGDQATLVKLLRISLLAVVVMAVSLSALGRGAATAGATRPPLLPGFLWVFVAFVALNSLGWIPPPLQQAMSEVSRLCLVVAIAALGVTTSFSALASAGWRLFALLLIETLWLAAFLLAAILLHP